MKRNILAAMMLGLASLVNAQRPMIGYKSTVVNDDGSVTFNYMNRKARQVSVDVQFAGKKEMKKDAQTGLWTVTLDAPAPDMYPYHFEVDGISMMDPQCDAYFPNEGFKNSLLEVPGRGESLPHDIKDVPHGQMDYVNYFSKSLNYTNNALVYLPPSYFKDTEKTYPVFYLISGTTDTEEVYYKVGRVNYILDNLIAEGKAKDMIVVLPYGNPNKLLPAQPASGMPALGFGNDVFSQDLVNDLMPYIESHYRTINDRDHRAIGGFSRGGNQGLANGLRNLDKFSYLCSYSSFTSTDIPGVYDRAKDTNKKIHLFWLGVGTDDFLYGNARDYTEFLDNKGIRCVKEYTHDKFGHTWMNAKYFLSKTLPLLFNPEASSAAMKAASPTLKKTGKEKQFTPGVMARLFPKSIVSPEYKGDDVVFRFKAPDAESVLLESELLQQPLAMSKDSDGVWSITVKGVSTSTFKYCFIADGIKVADPNNMYLSPDRGFKYSLSKAQNADPGNVEHGVVRYNYAESTALYQPAGQNLSPSISLIPGKNDTEESWFKDGGVDDILDRFLSQGKINPVAVFVGKEPLPNTRVIRADDYSTWKDRSAAFEAQVLKGESMPPVLDASLFKTVIDGKEVGLYTISKGNVTAQITNYGGFVVSLVSPDRNGNYTNVVTHYNTIEQYRHYNLGQVGPALGRYANRIGNATFTLKGKTYQLTKNSREHILHGGAKGFDHVVWDVVSIDASSLVLRCTLADGVDGFPGNLTTTLTYSITDDGGLQIDYEATTDKATVVNLSNHTYFNLDGAGSGDILDHILTVDADSITETTRDGIPTGRLLAVEGTPYDFRKGQRIGDRQMQFKGFAFGQHIDIPEDKVMNYDNNFCINPFSKKPFTWGQPLQKSATLYSPKSGRMLEVYSNHPGLQVYTGAQTAVALESQMYPDSPNHKNFPSTVLNPKKIYRHTILYKLSTK